MSGPEMEPGHKRGIGYLKHPRLDKGMSGAKDSRLGPGTPVVSLWLRWNLLWGRQEATREELEA